MTVWHDVTQDQHITHPTSPTQDAKIKHAITEQDHIGWKTFMDRFQSKQWRASLYVHFLLLWSQSSALVLMSTELTNKILTSSPHDVETNFTNNILHEEGSSANTSAWLTKT